MTRENLWEQTNAGLGMIEDQVEIDEYSLIQTTRDLNGGVDQTEDIG